MATIGGLVPPFTGHLNPILALAREMAGRGHRLVVAGIGDVQPAVSTAGLEFVAIGEAEFPAGSMERFFEGLTGRGEVGRSVFEGGFHRGHALVVFRDAQRAFAGAGADLLLVDQVSFGGESVAEHLGLPYVSVANALNFNREAGVPPHRSNRHYVDPDGRGCSTGPAMPGTGW